MSFLSPPAERLLLRGISAESALLPNCHLQAKGWRSFRRPQVSRQLRTIVLPDASFHCEDVAQPLCCNSYAPEVLPISALQTSFGHVRRHVQHQLRPAGLPLIAMSPPPLQPLQPVGKPHWLPAHTVGRASTPKAGKRQPWRLHTKHCPLR